MQYFPASIIEKTDNEGNNYNDLRIYNEVCSLPDVEVPEQSLVRQCKNSNPRVMYCITMYQESFGQLLQSLAGCIRSIIEMVNTGGPEERGERYGITLICDGIDKVPKEFCEMMQKYHLFDPKICHNAVMKYDANGNHVKRKFDKKSTTLTLFDQVSLLYNIITIKKIFV